MKKTQRFILALISAAIILSLAVTAPDGYREGTGEGDAFDVQMGEGLATQLDSHQRGAMIETLNWMVTWYVGQLLTNPPIYGDGELKGDFAPITVSILALLIPIYTIAILLVGVYVVFVSLIPPRRAHAKQLLTKLLVGMVLCSLAPMLFQTFLDIEEQLANEIFEAGYGAAFDLGAIALKAITLLLTLFVGGYACTLGIAAVALVFLSWLVVWLRVFMVSALGMIFPATLFLYMFDYTKKVGEKLLRYTLIWVFVPIVQVVFLLVFLGSESSGGSLGLLFGGVIALASFLLMAIAPLLMTYLLYHMGSLTVAAGAYWQKPSMTAVGHLMMGGGPAAFEAAGSQIGWQRAGMDDYSYMYPQEGKGVQERPGQRYGAGFTGAVKAFREYRSQGRGVMEATGEAMKTSIFGKATDTAISGHAERRKRFDESGGWGKAKVLGEQALAMTLQPVGMVFRAMGDERTDLMPPFMKPAFRNIGRALGGEDARLISAKRIGVGMLDAVTKSPLKTMGYVGLGLAMFTPASWAVLGAGVGASLGVSVLARGIRSKVEGRSRPTASTPPAPGGSGTGGGGPPPAGRTASQQKTDDGNMDKAFGEELTGRLRQSGYRSVADVIAAHRSGALVSQGFTNPDLQKIRKGTLAYEMNLNMCAEYDQETIDHFVDQAFSSEITAEEWEDAMHLGSDMRKRINGFRKNCPQLRRLSEASSEREQARSNFEKGTVDVSELTGGKVSERKIRDMAEAGDVGGLRDMIVDGNSDYVDRLYRDHAKGRVSPGQISDLAGRTGSTGADIRRMLASPGRRGELERALQDGNGTEDLSQFAQRRASEMIGHRDDRDRLGTEIDALRETEVDDVRVSDETREERDRIGLETRTTVGEIFDQAQVAEEAVGRDLTDTQFDRMHDLHDTALDHGLSDTQRTRFDELTARDMQGQTSGKEKKELKSLEETAIEKGLTPFERDEYRGLYTMSRGGRAGRLNDLRVAARQREAAGGLRRQPKLTAGEEDEMREIEKFREKHSSRGQDAFARLGDIGESMRASGFKIPEKSQQP